MRGTALYRTFFFLPSLTPAVAVAILWTWLLQPDVGLFNYLTRLADGFGLRLDDATWDAARSGVPLERAR